MPKETVLPLNLEPELRDEFLAEAQALRQPASQLLHELVREFVQRQRDDRAYDDFLRVKVARARESISMGRGHPHDDVEAEFAAWRAKVRSSNEG